MKVLPAQDDRGGASAKTKAPKIQRASGGTAGRSWRDLLPAHPAAELFPLLSKDDLEKLSRDIKEHGLRQPCRFIEDEDGRPVLLDGRNRLDALEHIGEEITLENSIIFEQLPADVDPYAYVISANIHRRHLTSEKKRELIGTVLKATPEKSNRAIAGTVKASHVTVGAVRAEMESTGQIGQLKKTVGKDRKARPSKRKRLAYKAPDAAAAPKPARDDIGPNSADEAERLRTSNEELENAKHRLEIENIRLRSEIEELKSAKQRLEIDNAELVRQLEQHAKDFTALRDKFVALSTPTARDSTPADDGSIPPFLLRPPPGGTP